MLTNEQCDELFKRFTWFNGSHAVTDYRSMLKEAFESQPVVAYQAKSKDNDTWGPPFKSKKVFDTLKAEGYEVRELIVK